MKRYRDHDFPFGFHSSSSSSLLIPFSRRPCHVLIVSPTFPFPFHAAPNSFPLIWTRIRHVVASWNSLYVARIFRKTTRRFCIFFYALRRFCTPFSQFLECLLDPFACICTRNLETQRHEACQRCNEFDLWRPPISTFYYLFG